MKYLDKNKYDFPKEMFFCMFLYDIEGDFPNSQLFEVMNAFCEECKLPLKTIWWSNYSKEKDVDVTMTIKNFLKKDIKIEEDALFGLYSAFIQREVAESYFDCVYESTLYNKDENYISLKIAQCALDEIGFSPTEFYEKLIEILSKYIKIPYGIFFYGNHMEGDLEDYPTTFYSVRRQENWKNWAYNYWRALPSCCVSHKEAPNLHLKGYFRKIYELNIINDKHLENHIEGILLKDWIEGSQKNGDLQKLGQQYLWKVETSEIKRIEKALIKENRIIACDEFTDFPIENLYEIC